MGLGDKLRGFKQKHLWSPITMWMVDEQSDRLVTSGGKARFYVEVKGEDDGTAERIELFLQLLVFDTKQEWPLTELPVTLGRHEVVVDVPTGLPPSCAGYVEYTCSGILHRRDAIADKAAQRVDVVSRPEDTYWPEGPRSGQDGPDDVRLSIATGTDLVPLGGTLDGTVSLLAYRDAGKEPVRLTFGATVTTIIGPKVKIVTKSVVTHELELAGKQPLPAGTTLELPFSLDLAADGLPPTLHNGGETSVVWEVRVRVGDTVAWKRVGVLDPEGTAGIRDAASPSLLSFLASLDTGGPR